MLDAVDWIVNDAPFIFTFVFFFCGAMIRGNTTYWVGRGVAKGVEYTRFERHLRGPVYQKAQRFIARWGVLAVPLSFLTIGVQSAVNASAGISKMPLRRYLPAVTVGALAWALIYTTIGMAVFYAWLALDWPWLVAGALIITLTVSLIMRARPKRAHETAGESDHA